MTSKILIADLVGLIVVFSALAIAILVARPSDIPIILWVLAFVVVGAIAVGSWHGEKWPTTPSGSLKVAGSSILVGVLFYIVDTVVAHFEHPEIRSGWSAPRLGECLVLLRPRAVCPGLTTIALGGVVRATCLDKDIYSEL